MKKKRIAKKAKKLACEGEEGSGNDQIDRLSGLPDDILHQIFSSFDTKYIVRASLLSKRWISLWTSAPNINFYRASFDDFNSFKNFVLTFLQRRPPDSKIHKLTFCNKKNNDKSLIKAFVDYALSHDVEHVVVKPSNVSTVMFQTHICRCGGGLFEPETVGLSKLTTLHLEGCGRGASTGFFDFLLRCPSLINLCLFNWDFDSLKISGPNLVNLTMEGVSCSELEISAPKVVSFSFKKWNDVDSFSGFNLPSLQDVEVESYRSISIEDEPSDYDKLFKLLQGLHNAQSVTLDSVILRDLINASDMDILAHQPSPFGAGLKTLMFKTHLFYPHRVPNKVKKYLLGDSPSAEVIDYRST